MDSCLFCKLIAKQIPAKIIHEDERTLAFHDINPQAPVHVLIIPKKHIASIGQLGEGDALLVGELIQTAKKLAAQHCWTDYRLVFNNGAQAGQSVFHIHMHLLSGRTMTWPPG